MPVKIFFCYAHEDEVLLNKLKSHLRPLQRMGLIETWHDRDISAGTKWEEEINTHLNEANIILLLVSPDFMDSDYCYGKEMQRALERDRRREARVIPIILRPVYWQDVLGTLQALPTDTNPVMSSHWHYQDEAFFNVVKGIRKVVEELSVPPASVSPAVQDERQQETITPSILTRAVQQVGNLSPLIAPLTVEKLRLRHTLTGHKDGVIIVAISADGQTIVSGSYDQRIRIWDLATGSELRTLTGHTGGINGVAISPDGQTLVSGSWDNTVKVWDLATGKELRTLTGHEEGVLSVAISPNGQYLVSGSGDTTIKVWDLATGSELRTLTGHTDALSNLAISPNGQFLVSGSGDTTIKVWDLATGKELRTLTGHTDVVASVAISPDGQTLVSGSWDNTVKVWDLATGSELRTLTSHKDGVWSVAISPDGQTLVSGSSDKTIKVWRA